MYSTFLRIVKSLQEFTNQCIYTLKRHIFHHLLNTYYSSSSYIDIILSLLFLLLFPPLAPCHMSLLMSISSFLHLLFPPPNSALLVCFPSFLTPLLVLPLFPTVTFSAPLVTSSHTPSSSPFSLPFLIPSSLPATCPAFLFICYSHPSHTTRSPASNHANSYTHSKKKHSESHYISDTENNAHKTRDIGDLIHQRLDMRDLSAYVLR